MPGNSSFVHGKQLTRLRLRKPHLLLFKPNIRFNVAIPVFVNDDLAVLI